MQSPNKRLTQEDFSIHYNEMRSRFLIKAFATFFVSAQVHAQREKTMLPSLLTSSRTL